MRLYLRVNPFDHEVDDAKCNHGLKLFCSVSPDDLLLRMGEYDLNSMAEPHQHIDRKVQIVASHPKFDPKTFEYDLRFREPVIFQPNIIPICIPEDDAKLVGESAWVTGWGRLYEGKELTITNST